MFIIDGLVWLFYEWLPDHLGIGVVVVLVLAVVFLGWRGSLALFPEKRCERCKGNGSWGPGLLRRECGKCHGKGRIPRVGSGR